MPVVFVSSFVFAIVLVFTVPLLAADAVPATSEPSWESLQCTLPSHELLLPENGGTSGGKMRSVIAGATVFFEGTISYLNCLGRAFQHDAVVAGNAVIKVARAMFGVKQKSNPAEPDPSAQPQSSAP